jgi:hypothetical protein
MSRLTGARAEQTRLAAVYAAAAGTPAEPLAQERLSAGRAYVASREQWLHWVDEGESLAPWADGVWAPKPATDPGTPETDRGGPMLSGIQKRIGRGEKELARAVAYRHTASSRRSAGPAAARDAPNHGTTWSEPMTQHEPDTPGPEATGAAKPNDDAIRAIVGRLARRQASGSSVIERAAILAEGADCRAVEAWILAHAGQPEAAVSTPKRGLHSARLSDPIGGDTRRPVRYVLPAGALG